MSTTLTVRPSTHDDNQSAANVYGTRFPAALEAIADGTYRFRNPSGKTKLVFYMPASSFFDITVDSVADKFGRTGDLVSTGASKIATVGAAPEIRVLGPFRPDLWTHKTGADAGYVTFTIASTTGAVKVAVLYD